MSPRRSGLLAAMILVFVAALAGPPSLAQQRLIHGIDPADMDLGADPRADFYRYANGGWLDRTTIPADRGQYGVFNEVEDRTTRQLLDLLNRLSGGSALVAGSDEWKAVRLYQQGTDLTARNAQGLDPIRPTLDLIGAIDSLEDLHRFLQGAIFRGVGGLYPVFVESDLMDSTVYAAYLGGPYLGLPNRDFYLDDTAENDAVRDAYVATAAALLTLAGEDPARVEAAARSVYAFERALAEPTLTREQQQMVSLAYNPTPVADLSAVYPLTDWPAHLAAIGLGDVPRLIVTELQYLRSLDAIVRATPLQTIKDYLALELLWSAAEVLSEEAERTVFEFQGMVLQGVEEQRPLEERVLDLVNGVLGDALGRLYVADAFPPEAKARIEDLVQAILVAFGVRLDANPWMSEASKVEAREKLAAIGVKVGYPDRWKSYAAVEVGASYAETVLSALVADLRRNYAKVGRPVDRSEWNLPPQVVNAFYNPLANEIVFPAGILQPPFFDYQADAASNFGAIGFVIGHEITHGFDLTGSQFDADGNLRDWWQPEDYERFGALNRLAVAQYGAIEVLPGVRVNGQITVGENVADLGGVQVAYDALQSTLAATKRLPAGAAAGSLTALTPEQRFFIAAASVWRARARDEFLATQVRVDVHAPAAVRAVQPLRNMGSFHEAFGIRPDDPMFLAPENRIVIW